MSLGIIYSTHTMFFVVCVFELAQVFALLHRLVVGKGDALIGESLVRLQSQSRVFPPTAF